MELITVTEAAKEKGISREAVYQAIRSGRLASQRVLGRIGIVRASLAQYQPNHHKIQAGRVRALQARAARRSGPAGAAGTSNSSI